MFKSYNEIFEQEQTLKHTYEYILTNKEIFYNVKRSKSKDIVFIACGSSYWLSLSAAHTLQEETGIRCYAFTSGEVIMNKNYYKKAFNNPLIIAISRSGSTSESLYAVNCFKKWYSCEILSIVEKNDTPLTNVSNFNLQIPWANEESICQTRSFSNLYLSSIMMAAILGNNKPLLKDLKQYIDEISHHKYNDKEKLKELINDFNNWQELVVLGNGKQYGVACEGAYINIEMAQFPSNYYPTLELRHGPIVRVDETSLVVFLSGGNARELEENLARDVLKKGARVLTITGKDDFKNTDYVFNLDREAFPETVSLYGILIMQLLAYFKALDLDLNPDQPEELVPWIEI